MPKLPEAVWRRRLEGEYTQLLTNPKFKLLSVNPEKTEYQIALTGTAYAPPATPGGQPTKISNHKASIYLTRDYPYAGGIEVVWDTPIYHPNIRQEDGRVCIKVLNQWSESTTLSNVIDALNHLIVNPNLDSPLNGKAAKFYYDNKLARPPTNIPGKPRVVL